MKTQIRIYSQPIYEQMTKSAQIYVNFCSCNKKLLNKQNTCTYSLRLCSILMGTYLTLPRKLSEYETERSTGNAWVATNLEWF